MKIIEATNRQALARLLARDRSADRAFERRVAEIVDRVRVGGDRALLGFARRFDGVSRRSKSRATRCAAAAATVPADVRRAIRQAARNIARVAFRQIPKHWDLEVVPGVSVEQRVEPLARVGCYVPGGRFPLPSSLLMTAVPARVAGVREIVVVCPRPEPAVMAAALEAGVTRPVPRRRRARDRGARLRHRHRFRASTRSSGPATATSRPPRRWCRPTAPSISTPARPRSSSSPAPGAPSGSPPTWSRRPSTIPTRGRSSSPGAASLAGRVAEAVDAPRRRTRRSSQQSLAGQRRGRSSPRTPTKRWRSPTASRPSIWSSIANR